MSNKKTIETYIEGFRTGNHSMILDCLTDDVVWEMPGFFYHEGKEAFDKEIENEAFTGLPEIQVIRMVEEGNIVVAEGTVEARFKNGDLLDAVFCDVFQFREGKIKQLTTYLMTKNPS